MSPEIAPEITRLLHLAIIAQHQAWDAANNLESLLDGNLVAGSVEWNAVRLHISDAIQELACEPERSLVEVLGEADADALMEVLRTYDAVCSRSRADRIADALPFRFKRSEGMVNPS